MNGVNGINAVTPQMTFKAKNVNKQEVYKIVDQINDRAVELLHKDRPLEEKTETILRKAMKFLQIKSQFAGEKIKPEEATVEHIKRADNELVEAANDAHRQIFLDRLKVTDPELYKEILRREAELKVGQMTNMEIIKEFINNILKKH